MPSDTFFFLPRIPREPLPSMDNPVLWGGQRIFMTLPGRISHFLLFAASTHCVHTSVWLFFYPVYTSWLFSPSLDCEPSGGESESHGIHPTPQHRTWSGVGVRPNHIEPERKKLAPPKESAMTQRKGHDTQIWGSDVMFLDWPNANFEVGRDQCWLKRDQCILSLVWGAHSFRISQRDACCCVTDTLQPTLGVSRGAVLLGMCWLCLKTVSPLYKIRFLSCADSLALGLWR